MGRITDVFKGIPLPKDARDRLPEADKLVDTLQSERDKFQSEKEKFQLEKETLEFQVTSLRESLKQKEAELEECKKSKSERSSGGSWMTE